MADLSEMFAGAARVLAPGVDDVARFEQPPRGAPGQAALVVEPASTAEVREVVRRAVAARVGLLPQGANTGLVGAAVPPPDTPTIVLSTDLLHDPPLIDADAATALVAAGTRLSELNAAAAEHGLHLPIDLAADPALGGMVATNTGGNRAVRYGPMRRYVLGVELVAADADASLLGRLAALRKDSRGVDAVHLAVGSGGTLGVVTRVVVALVALPHSRETWWLALAEPAAAIELLADLDRRRPGSISGFELVSRAALERTLSAPGAPPNPFAGDVPPVAVLAEWSFAGDADDAGVADDIAVVADRDLITDGRLVDAATAWDLRHRISDSLRTHGTVLGHDISAPRAELMATRSEAIAAIGAVAAHAEVCDFGHVGDGGLHLNVLFPHDVAPPSAETAAAIRRAVDDVVAAHGGSYSAEHGLGPLNAERWLATTPPVEQRLVAALKDVVDPRRILGHPRHPYNLVER